MLAKGLPELPSETLFVPPRDPERETWTGRRLGPEGACARLGFVAAASIGEAEARLGQALGQARRVWYRLGEHPQWDRFLLRQWPAWRRRQRHAQAGPQALLDPSETLAEMRLIKAPEEAACLRAAAAATAEGHLLVMSQAQAGLREAELEALLLYSFRRRADGWSYPPIVASGANACILHYTEHDRRLAAGELVLVDAGAEVQGYAADVTRCFPVDGRFASAQRAAYEVVLAAQKAALAAVLPGAPFRAVHHAALAALSAGLHELGVLPESPAEILERQLYQPYSVHNTSHWLGLDVHDAGRYVAGGSSRPLQPGMCLTVEPGLYFRSDDVRVPPELRGLGIRIEDDVLVTGTGCEILTAAIPKEVADVEQARAARRAVPPSLVGEPQPQRNPELQPQ